MDDSVLEYIASRWRGVTEKFKFSDMNTEKRKFSPMFKNPSFKESSIQSKEPVGAVLPRMPNETKLGNFRQGVDFVNTCGIGRHLSNGMSVHTRHDLDNSSVSNHYKAKGTAAERMRLPKVVKTKPRSSNTLLGAPAVSRCRSEDTIGERSSTPAGRVYAWMSPIEGDFSSVSLTDLESEVSEENDLDAMQHLSEKNFQNSRRIGYSQDRLSDGEYDDWTNRTALNAEQQSASNFLGTESPYLNDNSTSGISGSPRYPEPRTQQPIQRRGYSHSIRRPKNLSHTRPNAQRVESLFIPMQNPGSSDRKRRRIESSGDSAPPAFGARDLGDFAQNLGALALQSGMREPVNQDQSRLYVETEMAQIGTAAEEIGLWRQLSEIIGLKTRQYANPRYLASDATVTINHPPIWTFTSSLTNTVSFIMQSFLRPPFASPNPYFLLTSDIIPRSFDSRKRLDVLMIMFHNGIPSATWMTPCGLLVQYDAFSGDNVYSLGRAGISGSSQLVPEFEPQLGPDGQGWPPNLLPIELFQEVIKYLPQRDLNSMRLVNREFEVKASNVKFHSVVKSFHSEIYGVPQEIPSVKGKEKAKG